MLKSMLKPVPEKARRAKDTGHLELLELARQHGRLLLLLDGFDEAGVLERPSIPRPIR